MEKIVVYIIAFNAALVGIKIALDKIKDVTASSWDNKASDYIGIAATWIGKVIDIIGFNVKHK